MPKKLVSTPKLNDATPVTTSALPTVPSTFKDNMPLPSLFVFDLDYTLWPFWCDTHITVPVKPNDDHTSMIDRWGEAFTFYNEVPAILRAIRARGIPMGLASRTHASDIAGDLLRGLMIPISEGSSSSSSSSSGDAKNKNGKPLRAIDYFQHIQIFPGSKTSHLRRIQDATRKSGGESPVAFADMLFFDDETRNRNVESELGVTFWLVRDGLTKDEVDRGVWEWRKRRGIGRQGNGAELKE